ncbi:class I SAM-dependent methyltransferase [Blastopirellula sp. JC732]|uniref:Class I SAM-dependent methyltransferase n=1 Tax=Blastopirellula sediminis TaxID=2894196 RepID=A0A9X1MKP9_9BACT|nr:class I SAM-dependent methyltransferase [Blastopirellula sediminis]MCC9609141.1 class I SAM-dependent methyltransferase [Blastopirellula sediminis]MCC9628082.1 class I SAM-dependent methyltransferase [Blastopirellula sediminis]
MPNEWIKPEHSLAYLRRAKRQTQRQMGDETLLAELPSDTRRVLDLGCGAGHLLGLVLERYPEATGIGLDFSATMLDQARERFSADKRVELIERSLDASLPELGPFDAIVSSFAIHHCSDVRKRAIYHEAFAQLRPGGVFCNLEHVASPSSAMHEKFLSELDIPLAEDDPSNQLLDIPTQLQWLREIGYEEVDCYWKWREMALLIGKRPE